MNDCDQTRAAIRARLDGVEPLYRAVFVAEHLDCCDECRAWEAQALALHNRARHPSIAGRRAREATDRRQRANLDLLRYLLGIVAATELILCVVSLMAGRPLHAYRELAAADLAFAAGCLVAAVQPRRSLGLLPVAVALALLLIGTGARDLIEGLAQPFAESHHALELAGAATLVLLARRVSIADTA